MNQKVNKNNNLSNFLVFGRWPQTKSAMSSQKLSFQAIPTPTDPLELRLQELPVMWRQHDESPEVPTVSLRPMRRRQDEPGAGPERGAKELQIPKDDPEAESDGGIVRHKFPDSKFIDSKFISLQFIDLRWVHVRFADFNFTDI